MLSQNNNSPVISNVGDGILLRNLILKSKQGDREAFGQVYTTLYTPLYRYVLSKCRDRELVDDICQQTFLKFYEALNSYEPEKTPLAYLYTIAKRLLINHREKKTFESFDEALLESFDDNRGILIDELDIQNLSKVVDTYLPNLTEDEQEVIRLYFYAELTYKEISDTIDKEEAYIRKIKERALKKLRILTQHLNEKH